MRLYLLTPLIICFCAIAFAQESDLTISVNGTPALVLRVPQSAKATSEGNHTVIRTTDMSLHLWPVANAATSGDALPRTAELIKSEFIQFKARSTNEIVIAGSAAKHLSGDGAEADDNDPGSGEVVLFSVGGRVFAACVHGEASDGIRQGRPMLALLQTARPAGKASAASPTRLPEVTVTGTSEVVEEMPVGPYQQPEWTTHRRFSTTRVYVQRQPWEVEFEQWWRGRFYRDDTQKHRFQEELSLGLPYRMQVDLYETWFSDEDGHIRHTDFDVELRWALADWGKIPLNPTLYGEWKFVDGDQGPDVFEIKLLLGEELAPRWHWGLNLAWEQEVGEGRATELAWSQGISYTAIDEKLGVGLEMAFSHETSKGGRDDPEVSFRLGPSLQWRVFRNAHLDIAPLFGIGHDSPHLEAYVIFGIDLWSKGKESSGYVPASRRQ